MSEDRSETDATENTTATDDAVKELIRILSLTLLAYGRKIDVQVAAERIRVNASQQIVDGLIGVSGIASLRASLGPRFFGHTTTISPGSPFSRGSARTCWPSTIT